MWEEGVIYWPSKALEGWVSTSDDFACLSDTCHNWEEGEQGEGGMLLASSW